MQSGRHLLLTVLCSALTCGLVDGQTTTGMPHGGVSSVTLTSSAEVALVDDSLTFTCYVNGSVTGTAQDLSISHNDGHVCQITTTTCMDIRGAVPCICAIRNGVTVYQYHVMRVETRHQGEWLCAVGNSSVSNTLVQKTAARPFNLHFSGVGGSSVTLKRGDQAVFECMALGDPAPDVTLTLEGNGTTLEATNQSAASLTFTVEARLDDAIISCVASNRYGNASTNLQVIVECARTSTLVRVTPGIPLVGNATDVKCHVTQPPLSTSHDIVIGRNGDPVCAATLRSCLSTGLLPGCGCMVEQGQTVYAFSISNVSEADQGNWSCQVSQRCAQSSAFVQVESSPFGVQFSDPGRDEEVTLTENVEASVRCKAHGDPRPKITWSINGNVTQEEEGDATLGTLRLLPSRTMNKQEVTCTATNKHGVAMFRKRVTVFYAPSEAPTLKKSTEDTVEGDAIFLACSVRGGNPPTSNVTLSCGVQLSNTSADDVTLVFVASRELDGVSCVCAGQHSTAAYFRSSNTTLHVLYAPNATMSATFNSSDDSVRLVCRANGNPSSFDWTVEQRVGETTVRTLNGTAAGDVYAVDLYNVTVEDTGTYACLVNNSIGDSSGTFSPRASTDVRVKGAPLLAYDTPSAFNADAGTDAEIRVSLYSYPEVIAPNSFWRRNPTEPLNKTKYLQSIKKGMANVRFYDTNCTIQGDVFVLRILNFQASDEGSYIHHVCNSIGCDTKLYTVVVSDDPWPPSDLQVVSSTDMSVTLQWAAGYPGGSYSRRWFQVDYRRHGNESWTSVPTPPSREQPGSPVTFTVDGLPPFQIFHFRVRARTDRPGSSNFTEEIVGATFLVSQGDGGVGIGVAFGFVVCLVLVSSILGVLVCCARRSTVFSKRLWKIVGHDDGSYRRSG